MIRTYETSSSQRRQSHARSLRRAIDAIVEPLELRRMYAVTAAFAGGVLTVTGDNNVNAITVSRNAAGGLLVNNGAISIAGSAPTVANTTLIKVFGLGGDDAITLDETNGVLPAASISGGSGNDRISSGSGADRISGDDGNDGIFGNAGNDSLSGGNGNDTLTGGAGADQVTGDAGNDRMIWSPGDGSDVNDGGTGVDIVEVNGGNVSEQFRTQGNNGRVLFQRFSPLPFSIDIGSSENLILHANGGDDTFNGGTQIAGLIAISVDGGTGNDTLVGSDAADTLTGGDGDDLIDGKVGSDVAFMGSGDDVFQWDPGDGSDKVEGQGGLDSLLFNGAGADEKVDLSAQNGRLRFVRDVGTITMDVNGTEFVNFNALGGADTVTVHDLHTTDVVSVKLNLGGSDAKVDNVIVEGTSGSDVISVAGSVATGVSMKGSPEGISITGVEATDKLTINTLGGNDVVNALGLDANVISYFANGGSGSDVLIGSFGNDTMTGGDGTDILIGGPGVDQLDGGPGTDIVLQ